jgi:hypothetical protein
MLIRVLLNWRALNFCHAEPAQKEERLRDGAFDVEREEGVVMLVGD